MGYLESVAFEFGLLIRVDSVAHARDDDDAENDQKSEPKFAD